MRAAATTCFRSCTRRSRKPDKFNLLKTFSRDQENLRLNDGGKVEWGHDKHCPNADTATVEGYSVDEKFFHFLDDPAGFKGRRDQKLVGLLEHFKKREKLKKLRRAQTNDLDESHMDYMDGLSLQILNELNFVLQNIVATKPDLEKHGRGQIIAPTLESANVVFKKVTINRDCSMANCYWVCKEGYEVKARNALSKCKKEMRRVLATERMDIRRMPQLKFVNADSTVFEKSLQSSLTKVEKDMREAEKQPELNPEDVTDKSSFYQGIIDDYMSQFGGPASSYNQTEIAAARAEMRKKEGEEEP
eukprot:TRINITY_DN279_c0_g1_i1.p1 TRINITY_DN279_c0_g1~~TRINITY_DN279_c0_g1_i1.p1  ORF type:complete len:303 (+),score=56.51 TRINITY_DN279_c0_g1_i1:61-969(+)